MWWLDEDEAARRAGGSVALSACVVMESLQALLRVRLCLSCALILLVRQTVGREKK